MEKIRNGCKGIPEKIITDKLGHYRKAYNMFFYRLRGSCELVHVVPISCKKYGLEHNNNCAERDNERIKQRYKTTRGFKNSESAEDFLKLMDNCYNFVHPHMGLKGKTPAEEAGIKLNLERKQVDEYTHSPDLSLCKLSDTYIEQFSVRINSEIKWQALITWVCSL